MFKLGFYRLVKAALLGTLLLVLSGCCCKNKQDPLEGLNRGIYSINRIADRIVFRSIALFYSRAIPPPVQKCVVNFFQNLSEIPNVGNDILQGNWKWACEDGARFLVNSTWGIGGLFDIAALGGVVRHSNDFGITLGVWGYRDSFYLFLPLAGPTTIRDGIGRVATTYMGVWPWIHPDYIADDLYLLNMLVDRVALLELEPLIQSLSVEDEYIFIRDAFYQRRNAQIAAAKIGERIQGTATLPSNEAPAETPSGPAAEKTSGTTANESAAPAQPVLEGPPP